MRLEHVEVPLLRGIVGRQLTQAGDVLRQDLSSRPDRIEKSIFGGEGESARAVLDINQMADSGFQRLLHGKGVRNTIGIVFGALPGNPRQHAHPAGEEQRDDHGQHEPAARGPSKWRGVFDGKLHGLSRVGV